MREVVTLQIGNSSNTIGAYQWNLQDDDEDIDKSVLHCQAGVGSKAIFVPRLVLIGDALPVFVREDGVGDDGPSSVTTWEGKTAIYKRRSRSDDMQLTWKDITKVEYSDRSANLASLNGVVFPDMDQISDSIRFFVEGCDSLQGFHVNADGDARWARIMKDCMWYLKDEYCKSPVLALLHRPYDDPSGKQRRMIDDVMSLCCLFEGADLVVPLGIDQATGSREKLMAWLMDSVTLPYRLRSQEGAELRDFCELFSVGDIDRPAGTHLAMISALIDTAFEIQIAINGQRNSAKPAWTSWCDWTTKMSISDISAEHVTFRGDLKNAEKEFGENLRKYLSNQGVRRLCRTTIHSDRLHTDLPAVLSRTLASKELYDTASEKTNNVIQKFNSSAAQKVSEEWDITVDELEALYDSIKIEASDIDSS